MKRVVTLLFFLAVIPILGLCSAQDNPLIKPASVHNKPRPNNGDVPLNTVDSCRRLINDLITTYADDFPEGEKYLEELNGIAAKLAENPNDGDAKNALAVLVRKVALANPLLDEFDKIVVVRRSGNMGFTGLNAYTNDTVQRDNHDNELMALTNYRTDDPKNAKLETIFRHPYRKGVMRDISLSFDAKKIMYSSILENGRWGVFEVDLNGKNLNVLTPTDQEDVDWYDSCYLPESPYIVSASTAGIQGLPCENGGRVMVNLYRVNTKTKETRQLTFEQDSDWHPTVMHNGQVMYLRWEYTDVPHYFSRYVFSMNPDGRNQRALWGSGSYFPNAYKHPKQCPGDSTKLIGVVSGHHAMPEMGRLLLIDPNQGRYYPMRFRPENKEWGEGGTFLNFIPDVLPASVTGCVQELPGYGRDVVGNICDDVAGGAKHWFAHPFPLSDKYFLVCKRDYDIFSIYLIDVFDNMILLAHCDGSNLLEPHPVLAQPVPPVIPDNVDMNKKTGTVFCTDVYLGRGMEGVARGSAKSVRVIAYHYGYNHSGGHESCGQQSSWDIKRVLGTVKIEDDGSFFFEVPANTPFAMQVLDEEGAAIALMRSWTVVMPGEALSCNGCHENANDVTPAKMTIASRKAPQKLTPWYGPARSWGFQAELQPTLDKYCVGCHNDNDKAGGLSFVPHNAGDWRNDTSYAAINPYVRRPGPETDLDVMKPMEYHASTSELIQMLKKGHHGVELPQEAWERFYTWIDLNAPYTGMWNNPGRENRRLELQKLYAGIDDNPEEEYRQSLAAREANIEPIIPPPQPFVQPDNLTVENWPMSRAAAAKLAGGKDQEKKSFCIGKDHAGNDVYMTFVKIPAGKYIMGSEEGYPDERARAVVEIKKPFWMSETEVTNQQYECFDPEHDTRYHREDGKDHTTPGYIANHPLQPVARISWQEATKFCKWMSEKFNKKMELPTEAQWEWAARAGSDKQFFYGDWDTDWTNWANLADADLYNTYTTWEGGSMIHRRRPHTESKTFPLRDDRFKDKWFTVDYVKQYEPNAFGLYDMVGNVSEWTRSDYKPYPYKDDDGRNAGSATAKKVARGGSWNNRPVSAGSSVRFPYQPWQKVYNVGFRVIIEE